MTNSNEPIDLSKYAKGAKLRCVDARDSKLILDAVYVTERMVEETNVIVEGHKLAFLLDRFVPAEDEAPAGIKFKVGDEVLCERAVSGWEESGVRIGRQYTIAGLERSDGYLILVGVNPRHSFCPEYFSLTRSAAPVAASPKVDKPDPYTQHELSRRDDLAAIRTNLLPANEAARLRNVAALRAELDVGAEARWRRMVGPYHPLTGRPK